MDFTPFVGRAREITILQELWESDRPALAIIYGRRRIGKTRLLTHWIKSQNIRALFWVADSASAMDQLQSFSHATHNFESAHPEEVQVASSATWRGAFERLERLAERERVAVIIDEFTYLLEGDPNVAMALQNAWDHVLSNQNILLILSGSHLGMIKRQLLSHQAPLYGRVAAEMPLQPLPFGLTRQYFPHYQAHERVAIYAMTGGVPAYWERFNPKLNVSENIRRAFLRHNTLMQDEPRLLLHDFLKDLRNYVSMLKAIAHGATTPARIAKEGQVSQQQQISSYLGNLCETGFVERFESTTLQLPRGGRYVVTDPFLRFYFRFLSGRQSQLVMGIQDPALDEIRKGLLGFIGKYTWEELCREWVQRASAVGKIPLSVENVGSSWTGRAQVDVAGIDAPNKNIYLGECKWTTRPVSPSVLKALVQKTSEMVPKSNHWQVFYLGFSRSGWTAGARDYAASIRQQERAKGNWDIAGMRLLDLEEVDNDLHDFVS